MVWAGGSVISGGLPQARWLRSSGIRAGRNANIFTRRYHGCCNSPDAASAGGTASDWGGSNPAIARGRNCEPEWGSERTYEMDIKGGKTQTLGPADFVGSSVSNDGKHIAGHNFLGEAVVFDLESQKVQPIPGIGPQEQVGRWAEDGQGVFVLSGTPWEAQVDRVEVATGKRTTVQKVNLSDKSGSTVLAIRYAERSPTSVYLTVRLLGSLYVVEGLE
jgi:hypothetical protein